MGETATLTLTDFLLARIVEDETDINDSRLGDPHWWMPDLMTRSRLLAECEAKRRILEMHHVGDPDEWNADLQACRLCQWDEDCDSPKHDYQHGAGRFPCDTLRALAAVYADHPDYRDEWR